MVALLGADGVGKSSVAAELARLMGATIVKTPGPAFDATRKLAELVNAFSRYLYYGSAVSMTGPRIRDALRSGPVVVDRYIQCTVAFHAAMNVPVHHNLGELLGLPVPTLTIHLTVCPEEAAKRIAARAGERPDAPIENNIALQARVVEMYRKLDQFGFTGLLQLR